MSSLRNVLTGVCGWRTVERGEEHPHMQKSVIHMGTSAGHYRVSPVVGTGQLFIRPSADATRTQF